MADTGGQFSLTLVLDAAARLQWSTTCAVHFVLAGLSTLLGKIIETKPHTERLFPNSLCLGALDATAAGQAS